MCIYIYRYPISHIFWQPHIILLLFHQFFASRLMCIRYLRSLCWMPPAISNESMKGYSEVPRSRRTETWTFRSGEFRWRIGQTLTPCWKPQFWPSRTEIGNMVPSTDSGFCQGPPESRWLPRAAVHGGWPKQHRHPPHSCHRRALWVVYCNSVFFKQTNCHQQSWVCFSPRTAVVSRLGKAPLMIKPQLNHNRYITSYNLFLLYTAWQTTAAAPMPVQKFTAPSASTTLAK